MLLVAQEGRDQGHCSSLCSTQGSPTTEKNLTPIVNKSPALEVSKPLLLERAFLSSSHFPSYTFIFKHYNLFLPTSNTEQME